MSEIIITFSVFRCIDILINFCVLNFLCCVCAYVHACTYIMYGHWDCERHRVFRLVFYIFSQFYACVWNQNYVTKRKSPSAAVKNLRKKHCIASFAVLSLDLCTRAQTVNKWTRRKVVKIMFWRRVLGKIEYYCKQKILLFSKYFFLNHPV